MYRPTFILLRNVILQRYYNAVTMKKTFRFVNAHLTVSNKGELANQNAVYRIIALECSLKAVPVGRRSGTVDPWYAVGRG